MNEQRWTHADTLDQIQDMANRDGNPARALERLRAFHDELVHEAALSTEGLVGYFITAVFMLEVVPDFLPYWGNLRGAGAIVTLILALVGAWGILQIWRAWKCFMGMPRIPRPHWIASLDSADNNLCMFQAGLEEYRQKNKAALEHDNQVFTDRARSTMSNVGKAFLIVLLIGNGASLLRELSPLVSTLDEGNSISSGGGQSGGGGASLSFEGSPAPEQPSSPPKVGAPPEADPPVPAIHPSSPGPMESSDANSKWLFKALVFVAGAVLLYTSLFRPGTAGRLKQGMGSMAGLTLLGISIATSFNLVQIKGVEFTAFRFGGSDKPPIVNLDKLISITSPPDIRIGNQAMAGLHFEHIATLGPFDTGADTLPQGFSDQVAAQIKDCVKKSQHSYFLAIGGADQRHLGPQLKSSYESNTGLSLARAQWVKNQILALLTPEHISPEKILALNTGCRIHGLGIAADKLSEDRKVDVYAIWFNASEKSFGPDEKPLAQGQK